MDVGRRQHRDGVPHADEQHERRQAGERGQTRASRTRGATSCAGRRTAATTRRRGFRWDLFLLAGQIEDDDRFGSPDGLWVDPDGRVWIQTDGRQPEGANDQMLAANPYLDDDAGAPEIRRFFTGVRGCEVTGVVTTPDQRTMFVNVQHPGESVPSTWPQDDGFDTPRAATVVITKDDGGVIGT